MSFSQIFGKPSAMLLALALAGCITVGPDYRAPDASPPPRWHNAEDAQAAKPAQLDQWWQQFNDPVLNQLQAKALASSPDLRTAFAKIKEARARYGLAEAGAYPSLSAGASAQRNETAGSGKASDTFRLGLDASWEIDLFGGTRRSTEAAAATEAASIEAARDARVTLVAEVATDYLDLRTQQQRLRIARENAGSQAETEQLTRWRVQAGLLTELELAQASSALEQTRASEPKLESTIEADLNKLAVLCGISRAEAETLLQGEHKLPVVPATLGVSVPAEVLRQRPDIRTAERKLAAQTANIGVATAELYPSLKLSGSIALSAAQADQLLRGGSANNSLLASLTAPIFDAGRIRRNIEIQNALQEQSLIAYEKTVAQALADVETALAGLAKARERSASLNRALDSARLAEDIARKRFAAGLIDFPSLLETQRSLLSLEDQNLSAQGDQASALVQLYKALGGGWQDDAAPTAISGVSPQ